MPDLGHKFADKELDKLIKHIRSIYTEAYGEAVERSSSYWDKFSVRERKMREKLKQGLLTEEEFKTWRWAQVGRGLNLNAIADNTCDVLSNAGKAAAAALDNTIANVYSMNANYSAYMIERHSDAVSFSLLDENTVKRLVLENPDLMPYYPKAAAMRRGFDVEYGKNKILGSVRSGILQGLSIPQIADKMLSEIVGMEQASATRAARTAVTSAENGGRQQSYEAAAKSGLNIRKEWLATLDMRTRTSHGHLDGERVDWNGHFSNGLKYPADPSGRAEEIYNCRCTMFAVLPQTEKDSRETYDEWKSRKTNELGGEKMFEIAQKMVVNRKKDIKQAAEYRALLGREYIGNIDDFQEMKYNDPDAWAEAKREFKAGKKYLDKYPNSDAHVFRASYEITSKGLQTGVLVPSVPHAAKLVPTGRRDPNHIFDRMTLRGATIEDMERIVNTANYMLVQWGGERRCYITSFGAVVITKYGEDEWAYKTVWMNEFIDDNYKKLIEVMEKHGLEVDKG